MEYAVKSVKKDKPFLLILILGSLTAMGPLSIDMYLPAFPDIARELNTSIGKVALSLSGFFIGLSVGQLIYGPLLERFGRKKPLYAGLCLYILASAGCVLATSVNQFIFYRVLQALGGCAGLVAARAIVRDLFTGKDVARVFSMLMMVVAVSPIIAPTAGSYITTLVGWRYIFVVLIVLPLFILAGSLILLPESKKPDRGYPLKLFPILKTFAAIIRQPQFFIYAFTGAISYSGLYAYLSGSPNVYMEIFKMSEKHFGWLFAVIAMGLISASQINALSLKKYSSENIILIALSAQCIIAFTLAGFTFLGISGLFITTILIFSYLFCLGFIFPNASALSLAKLGHIAGNASALMGAVQMTMGAIASAIVSLLQEDSALPMVVVMAFCAILAWGLYYRGSKRIHKIEVFTDRLHSSGGVS